MNDIFSNTTEINFLQRIGGSFKAVISGALVFCVSFVLLWKNEGCAVSQQAALNELKSKVVKADAQNPSVAFNGQPVLLQAALYSKNFVHDDQFVIKQPFIKIQRIVEMYQWIEKKEKNSKRSGSGTPKITYSKEWSEENHPSQQFKEPSGHVNPTPAFTTKSFVANEVSFGKFKGENILNEIQAQIPLPLSNQLLSPQIENLKTSLKKNSIQVIDNTIYLTTVGFQRPEIGDLRIKYLGVKSEYYTAIGTQVDANDLKAFVGSEGYPMLIVEKGVKNIKSMIKGEQKRNAQLTWIVRGFGVFLMFLGLMALLRPFMSFLEMLPLIGTMINFGVVGLAAAISLILSSVIILVAKLFYNPIFLVPVVALIGGYFYFQSKKYKSVMSHGVASHGPVQTAEHPVLSRVASTPPQVRRRTIAAPASFKKSA